MPYRDKKGNFEKARSTGHVPIAQNPVIAEKLKSFRLHVEAPAQEVDSSLLHHADQLQGGVRTGKWVMSFDGSPHEVAVRENHPSTRVGYVQVASVLVDLSAMLSQEVQQFVDPTALKNATSESLISTVMPSSNVCRADMETVRDSWRAEIFEVFKEYRIEDTPLLETYLLLVSHSDKAGTAGSVRLPRCSASDSCTEREIEVPREGCKCKGCGGFLFPSDALRVHEEVLEEHSNVTALGRLMGVLEKLATISYLNFLMVRQPRVLGDVAFVIDGPLAVFGPQAWLHAPILSFLNATTAELKSKGFAEPLIVGIEKSGQFAEHANAISGMLPPRTLMSLPDDYIYRHILTFRSKSNTSFGHDTYYGQKFFYKTQKGQMLSISVPKQGIKGINNSHPAQFEALPSVLALLDRIGTTLYKDALIPVALAHSFAAIPLRTGSKVLKLLSKDLLASE